MIGKVQNFDEGITAYAKDKSCCIEDGEKLRMVVIWFSNISKEARFCLKTDNIGIVILSENEKKIFRVENAYVRWKDMNTRVVYSKEYK